MTLRRVARTAVSLLLAGLAASWIAGSIMSWPHASAVAPPAPPGRIVHFAAADGVPLTGSYWPGMRPDAPAILLLHGIDSSRASFAGHAAWLNGLGYAVLAIDFRGHGESGAAFRSFGLYEARDAAAALAFLRAGNPGRRVGLIGISLGGAAALLGEDGPLPVQAMVLQAVYPDLRDAIFNRIAQRTGPALAMIGEPLLSYQSWLRYGVPPDRLAPAEAIRLYHGPLLVIGGGADLSTPPDETRRLYDAAPGPKELWLLDGLGHAAASSVWTDAYRARVRALFARALGEPEQAETGHLP
ncbi:MAG: alpha/beta fold hydrolase [Sphingomonadaceae bacterium]|nr:alpha/beta fold hydrolase [Sphingomonadaceae bacterium]